MEIEKLTINDAKAFDLRLKNLNNVYPDNYYDELESSGYIKLISKMNGKHCYEKTFKAEKHSFELELEEYKLSKAENDSKIKEKEELEIKLAKSNIKANELNIKNARKNTFFTWVNIAFGVLNLVLLAIQILLN